MIKDFFDEINQAVDDYIKSINVPIEMKTITHNFQIPEDNFLPYVEFLGTAHFSNRSADDVLQIIKNIKSVGVCLELCPNRYDYLLHLCDYCLEKNNCSKKCEFITAIEVLSKINIDVWLIDMNQEEVTARVLARASINEAKAWNRLQNHIAQREAYGMKLWEEGLKDEAMQLFNGDLELIKKAFPTLWRVLILERNALMACRIIYLISTYLSKGLRNFKIIVFTGAAHVEGLQELLKRPPKAFLLLDKFGVAFSPPNIIKKTN